MSYMDAHIHLEQYDASQCEKIVSQAKKADIQHVIAVSMDLASSQRTYALSKRYGEFIIPAYGFHPEQKLPDATQEQQLLDWIAERHHNNEHFAIGEIGLPYYRALEAKEQGQPFDYFPYIAFLDRMLDFAKQLDRPVALHAVYEDAAVVCDLLQKNKIEKAHFHWFKGSAETIDRMIEAGYYISITPDVFVEKEIQELVERYPLGQMMVETDGPWPFEGPFTGKMTVPVMVIEVVKEIARLKKLPMQQVAETVLSNTLRLYQ